MSLDGQHHLFYQHNPDAAVWDRCTGGNPVISSVAGRPRCRDPKVFWYPTGPTGHWVMTLTAGHEIWIYISNDLRTWKHTDAITVFDLAVGSLESHG